MSAESKLGIEIACGESLDELGQMLEAEPRKSGESDDQYRSYLRGVLRHRVYAYLLARSQGVGS